VTGVERLRAAFQSGKVLVPYLTCGDPDLSTTSQLLDALVDGGAGVIELGIPFSDPMADGPVLQLAAERALKNPFSMRAILQLVTDYSSRHTTPLILFGYYNPFFRYGVEALARDAAAAGACGVLCVDLPPEEAGPLHSALSAEGLALIPLITPVSGSSRVDAARGICDAFGYYVSATGVTGLSLTGRTPIADRVAEVRKQLDRPLVVGFGVRTPADAKAMAQSADGVVVGSALVQLAHDTATGDRPAAVRNFARSLSHAIA